MLITIITICIFLSFTVTTINILFFLYENVNSEGAKYFKEKLSMSISNAVFLLFIQSIIFHIVIFMLYPLGFFHKNGLSIKKTPPWYAKSLGMDSRPVIMIHGLYHNPSAWILLKYMLYKNGFRNVFTFKYNSFNGDIFQVFSELRVALKKVKEIFPEEKIILVGHSLGGLLARHYACLPDNDGKVEALITLAAPHYGSKLAVLGVGRLARSLVYMGQDILDMINEEEQLVSYGLNIYSSLDEYVLPEKSLHLPEKFISRHWTEERTPPLSHLGFTYYMPVLKNIMMFLKNTDKR